MATEILMPALSPTMEDGTLVKWLKSEGDDIRAGDVIAEIETDKATMEVEAVDEGRLARIVVPEGSEAVKVNTVIALLVEEGEKLPELGASTPPAQAAPATPPSPASAPPRAAPAPPPRNSGEPRILASPLARRLAGERGIALDSIAGSGPHGRIIRADVEAAPTGAAATASTAQAPAPLPVAAPTTEAVRALFRPGSFDELPLDGMRRAIAARLSEAKRTIPHFYLRRSVEIDTLLALRKRLNRKGEARGIRISVNDLIVKAVAQALQDVPEANAVWAEDRILRLTPSDIAVAVAVEGGLYTPVVRDAETKALAQLSAEIATLVERARARKLTPDEYQGGSFAISNLGMYGVESFDAVINPPHGAILAVGAGRGTPVMREGEIVAATVMSLTLSVDHRVINGAPAAELLAAIAGYLEDPATMLL